MSCGRQFCPRCGQELIHRDNRHGHESSCAINTIVQRQGPPLITLIDIDSCVLKTIGRRHVLRVIEHKQPQQWMKPGQQLILTLLDCCLRYCAEHGLWGLAEGSGSYVMRGQMIASDGPFREVDFDPHGGPQTIHTPQGDLVRQFRQRAEFYDWLCCGIPGEGRGRQRR